MLNVQKMWLRFPVVYFGGLILVPGLAEGGLLVLALWGMWACWVPSRRASLPWGLSSDKWLSLAFMSVFLFKLVSAVWAQDPSLAVRNAFWHIHFLLWPLVFCGLAQCNVEQKWVDKGIGFSLLVVAAWYLGFVLTGWSWLAFEDAGTTHPGVLAQVTLVLGVWALLALTRPVEAGGSDRVFHAFAALAAPVVLVASGRRLELMGYLLLVPLFLALRFRQRMSPMRWLVGGVMFLALAGLMVYARWEKFELGLSELNRYAAERAVNPDVLLTSWGARLEMYRVGLLAFGDHPWLGLSAGVRPYLLTEYHSLSREVFGHRHFHSQLLQTLVEGGLVGLAVMLTVLVYSIRVLIIKPWAAAREPALLALALVLGFMIEGAFSAALTYGEANALFVVASAWLWLKIRELEGVK